MFKPEYFAAGVSKVFRERHIVPGRKNLFIVDNVVSPF